MVLYWQAAAMSSSAALPHSLGVPSISKHEPADLYFKIRPIGEFVFVIIQLLQQLEILERIIHHPSSIIPAKYPHDPHNIITMYR